MTKPDNHIELGEILGQIFGTEKKISGGKPAWFKTYLHELAPKTYHTESVNIEDDIAEAMRQIEDFYRNKIPEKKEFIDEHGFYDDKTKLALINNFKGYNQAIDGITAQFNSKGDNDE